MNKMNEVAKMLGVELGEKFNIEGYAFNPCTITKTNLIDADGSIRDDMLVKLIAGFNTVKKLPFKPEFGETYWVCEVDDVADSYCWEGDMIDLRNYKLGNVFRTKQDVENNVCKFHQELEEYCKNN